ncbi:hypothetical protein [Sulfurimonas sp. HSL3-7]|uniref:hypothetical protein n=1 Tax=Sulfonitrofixus jiaomeiensis TaxID=3131938 RepID=UPI0031F737D6
MLFFLFFDAKKETKKALATASRSAFTADYLRYTLFIAKKPKLALRLKQCAFLNAINRASLSAADVPQTDALTSLTLYVRWQFLIVKHCYSFIDLLGSVSGGVA